VTVCVAGICQGRVVGASDRMLTAGDIEFEPEQSKLIQVNAAMGAMLAGSTLLQSEIMQRLLRQVNERIEAEPQNWWKVEDVANAYFSHYLDIKRERALQKLLHPLGLDYDSFVQKQKEMNANLTVKLSQDLINFEMDHVAAIFGGIDATGPHIYIVRNDGPSCQDWAGFASIGVGAWHADSHLMIAGHHKLKTMPETLLQIYTAKKRSEVAPGVGSATDMFLVGPGLGGYIEIGGHVINELQNSYETMNEEFKISRQNADRRIAKYVEEIISKATTQDQSPQQSETGADLATSDESSKAESGGTATG
jgi:hypothetical protein